MQTAGNNRNRDLRSKILLGYTAAGKNGGMDSEERMRVGARGRELVRGGES